MVQYGGLMEGRSSRGALFYVVRLRVMVQYGVLLKGEGIKYFLGVVKNCVQFFFNLRQVEIVLHPFWVGLVLWLFYIGNLAIEGM